MSKRKYKRRKKLIKPRFQLKVALACVGIALISALALLVMLNEVILDFADKGWVDTAQVQTAWSGVLLKKLLLAMAILAPLTLALGVILMHRVAGPMYRFEVFLKQVAAGKHPDPCHLRRGDELMELCELLNRFTQPIRTGIVDVKPFTEAVGVGETSESSDAPARDEPLVERLPETETSAA